MVPHLLLPKRGFKSKALLYEIVNAILYKLKTGIQWSYLPAQALFSTQVLSHKTVFGHFCNWCKAGVWQSCWSELLKKNKSFIDLSSGDLDGSHTTALRGGEQVAYQGRKKHKTTNSLYFTNRQGIPLVMLEPIAGNHNDLFDKEICFEDITNQLTKAEIPLSGLFINADAGFDSQKLRKIFIVRTNARVDSFRSLLNRFDTTLSSWMAWNFLAFIVIGLKKFKKTKKSR
ncbi:transposase [Myroides sp. M-43]|uniref:transposase n=1 Tax=Myroides oncorhynchi TaxID=2893756 RepID=UPI001E5FFB30|nr:transposase [Myroides oncorhynchi]